MISLPHVVPAIPLGPAVALVVSVVGGLACARRQAEWAPMAGALSVLAGLAMMVPAGRLGLAATTPRGGIEALLVPAAACAAAGALAAWTGRGGRLLPSLLALFVGWWLARTLAGPAAYWRVLFGVPALSWVVTQMVGGLPWRAVATGLALWGGLVVAGSGAAVLALLAVAAALGLAIAPGVMSGTVLAAIMAAEDVAGGRAALGHANAIDVACGLALLAPIVTDQIGKRPGMRPEVSAALAAAAVSAGVWFTKRAFFT